MWVGNVNADASGSYSNFNLEVDGERLEISEQRDDAGQVVNSRSFRFDAETGNMLGGTEISAGKIVEYGANHTKLSESLSLTLGANETIAQYLVAEEDLEGVPQTLQGTIATYADTQFNDMSSETTYFTIDDGGNYQILGYANQMSMGVEEAGTEGLEDLQLAVDAAQLVVDDAQLAVTQAEGMVTSASDDVADREGILAGAQAELAAMVEAEDADAYAAKQLEITGYETDLDDAEITKTEAETALSGYQEDLTAANAALTSAQEALTAEEVKIMRVPHHSLGLTTTMPIGITLAAAIQMNLAMDITSMKLLTESGMKKEAKIFIRSEMKVLLLMR